jgi:hypothetical protein
MNLGTGFSRRHPRSVIFIRVLVTAWLLGLTGILLANGYWGWALVTLAGAMANIVLAYRVSRAGPAHRFGHADPARPCRSRPDHRAPRASLHRRGSLGPAGLRDEVQHPGGPSGLVGGVQVGTGVAVEVLVM